MSFILRKARKWKTDIVVSDKYVYSMVIQLIHTYIDHEILFVNNW